MVAVTYRGVSDYRNEATPILIEYNTRMRLSKIGYQFDPRDLEPWKADAFAVIASEIQRLESDALKSKKGG